MTVAVLLLRGTLITWFEGEFDRGLVAKGRALVTLTSQQDHEIDLEFADEYMPEFERKSAPEYFELWSSKGHVIERSNSLGNSDLTRQLGWATTEPRILDLRLPDGRRGRSVQLDFVPQVEDDDGDDIDVPLEPAEVIASGQFVAASIVIAISRVELDQRLERLDLAIGLFGLTILLSAIVSVSQILRQGLIPLQELAEQVQAIGTDSLGLRVELPKEPTELQPIVEQLNQLLARLDDAFRKERLLSSNLAHELRTPLAELQSLAEVVIEWPEDTKRVQRYFSDVMQIGEQMQRVVVQLLLLARVEESRAPFSLSKIDLETVITEAWSGCALEAGEPDAPLDRPLTPSVTVYTDPDKLAMILRNLLSNALTYKRANSSVSCWFGKDLGGAPILRIRNWTDELEEADLEAMFDRFWRKDAARAGTLNVGLGLTLVQTLTRVLGIGLATRLVEDEIFEVDLTFPVDPPVHSL